MGSGTNAPDGEAPSRGRVDVRDATPADAAACAAIYAPYVRGTTASFESDPPTVEQMAQCIAAALERHAWVVATAPTRGGGAGARAGRRAAGRRGRRA